MKIVLLLLCLGSVFIIGLAFVALVVREVLRRRAAEARHANESEDPLARMFRENREENEARQRATVAALPEGEPLREWVARGGDVGWFGFSDYLFGLFFSETAGDLLGAVRGVRYEGDREPNFKGLPQPDGPFGVDLTSAYVSVRGLAALARYPGLAALSVHGKSDVTDAGLKTIARMTDLVTLDLRYTEVTGAGLGPLAELPALRFLSLCLMYDFAAAAETLAELTQLRALGGGSGISDDDLRALRPLEQLTHLELGTVSTVTDAGLRHLRPFGRLAVLQLVSSQVTDAGLAHVGALGALQKLTLTNYEGSIRGPGLVGLAGLRQLRELRLNNNGLTGEGFECFAGLTALRQLFLGTNPITDDGLARMSLPPGLQWLGLDATRITDAGVARLELPPSVTDLGLSGTAITDASVPHLARFQSLERLGISETKLTLAGAHRLSDALPNCTIQMSFPK